MERRRQLWGKIGQAIFSSTSKMEAGASRPCADDLKFILELIRTPCRLEDHPWKTGLVVTKDLFLQDISVANAARAGSVPSWIRLELSR
jgi:hypothetical protein